MMKQEFEQVAKTTVDDMQWAVIETVYNYHPSIPEVNGKKVIADLYKIGGYKLIEDMHDRAYAIYAKNKELSELKIELETAAKNFKDEVQKLTNRYNQIQNNIAAKRMTLETELTSISK